MTILDTVLSGFGLWRRFRGGIWNEVMPYPVPSVGPVWIRGDALASEHVCRTERW